MNQHYEQTTHYQTNENLFHKFSPGASDDFYSESFTCVKREQNSDDNSSNPRRIIVDDNPGHIVDDINVTSTDVLSERGKGASAREGNKFYLRLIRQYKDEYQNQPTTKLKRKVAQRVLDIIKYQEPQGRFMKSVGGKRKAWVVQDDTFAMTKITQALREKIKNPSPKQTSIIPGGSKQPRRRGTLRKRMSWFDRLKRVSYFRKMKNIHHHVLNRL